MRIANRSKGFEISEAASMGPNDSPREPPPTPNSSVFPETIEAGDNLYEGFKFDRERVKELFQQLDVNKDGRIDIQELTDGLHKRGISHLPAEVQVSTYNVND